MNALGDANFNTKGAIKLYELFSFQNLYEILKWEQISSYKPIRVEFFVIYVVLKYVVRLLDKGNNYFEKNTSVGVEVSRFRLPYTPSKSLSESLSAASYSPGSYSQSFSDSCSSRGRSPLSRSPLSSLSQSPLSQSPLSQSPLSSLSRSPSCSIPRIKLEKKNKRNAISRSPSNRRKKRKRTFVSAAELVERNLGRSRNPSRPRRTRSTSNSIIIYFTKKNRMSKWKSQNHKSIAI